MRKGIIIRFIVLGILALATLLALRSSSIKKQPVPKGRMEECCQEKCKAPDDNNLIWETFSRQLITVSN